jgi:hypothetical protein
MGRVPSSRKWESQEISFKPRSDAESHYGLKGSGYSQHQTDSIRFESFFLGILPSLPQVRWPLPLQAVRPAIA